MKLNTEFKAQYDAAVEARRIAQMNFNSSRGAYNDAVLRVASKTALFLASKKVDEIAKLYFSL